jgi:hypothetical protein
MRHCCSLNALVLLVVIQLVSLPTFAHEGQYQALVLVTASDSEIEKLQPRMFRKLFLNVPVTSVDQPLIPLINTSDDLLYEIFLQKVVYMSERHYERMLISKTFRTGRPRPARFSDNAELVTALNSISGAVSVMWRKIAEKEKAIRIVQTLWEDRH